MRVLLVYESTACTAADAPPTTLRHESPVPVMLVFVHPKCPCTRATVSELQRLMRKATGRLQVRAHVFSAPELGPDWHRTALWYRLARIPDVAALPDPGGAMAQRFGSRTSGQCLLYGVDGALQFCGGITPARGHEGDSDGSRAVLDHVLGTSRTGSPAADRITTSVYGCDLRAPTAVLP